MAEQGTSAKVSAVGASVDILSSAQGSAAQSEVREKLFSLNFRQNFGCGSDMARMWLAMCQDHGKGGLGLRGLAVTTETAMSAHNRQNRQSGKKKEPKPKLFGPDIFQWGRGLPRERVWGQKSSICPSKPGKSNSLGGISLDFAGISRGRPKSLREKKFVTVCVQFSSPSQSRHGRLFVLHFVGPAKGGQGPLQNSQNRQNRHEGYPP